MDQSLFRSLRTQPRQDENIAPSARSGHEVPFQFASNLDSSYTVHYDRPFRGIQVVSSPRENALAQPCWLSIWLRLSFVVYTYTQQSIECTTSACAIEFVGTFGITSFGQLGWHDSIPCTFEFEPQGGTPLIREAFEQVSYFRHRTSQRS